MLENTEAACLLCGLWATPHPAMHLVNQGCALLMVLTRPRMQGVSQDEKTGCRKCFPMHKNSAVGKFK